MLNIWRKPYTQPEVQGCSESLNDLERNSGHELLEMKRVVAGYDFFSRAGSVPFLLLSEMMTAFWIFV